MKKNSVLRLTECAILIALGTILSVFKMAELPYGGSVTMASLLPLVLISYRYGIAWGLGSGLVYGVIQQLLGLNNLKYCTSFYSYIVVILFDYVVAFAVIGLAGLFRKRLKNQSVSLVAGSFFVCLLRYACHVFSGATVWAGISIPTGASFAFSLIYNATYMVPETIVLCLAALYVGRFIDFKAPRLKRLERAGGYEADLLQLGAFGVLTAALIYDVIRVFSVLQNAETGRFDLSGLTGQPFKFFLPIIIVTSVAIVAAVILLTVRARFNNKENEAQTDDAAEEN